MDHVGLGAAFDPSIDVYIQDVFHSRSDPMTITSYEEAQLMIAEVDPARSVGIINALRAVHGIAAYVPVDAPTTALQVRVERIQGAVPRGHPGHGQIAVGRARSIRVAVRGVSRTMRP